ncbi:zinc finger protein 98-like [Phlebotomus papatasi]|uniref:zinc finger protein 98-like n=1 Tax=Phlebotomus papatasi TaxID=29031 RepID=UPI0024845EB0|nr:zinc finger protein 98-like [Phlebotomus papatasi]
MSQEESHHQILLIKIKFQVLKLVECIEKLNEVDQKEAVHFILYRISQVKHSIVSKSLDIWGKVASGRFKRETRRKCLPGRCLEGLRRLDYSLRISQIVHDCLSRRNSCIQRQSSELLRRYLQGEISLDLHVLVCGKIRRKFPDQSLLEISYDDEEGEESHFGDEGLSFEEELPLESEIPLPKAEKRKAGSSRRKKKRPKKDNFNCPLCPKEYKRRQNVVDHFTVKHPGFCPDCGDEIGFDPQTKVNHNKSKHLDEYPYVCDICGESMSRNQQYQAHLETHKRPLAPKVDPPKKKREKRPKQPQKNRYSIVLPDGIICPVCGAIFPNRSLLNVHKSRFHSDKLFQCEICSIVYKIRSSFLRHKRNHHSGQEKKFVCETCGAKYSSNSGLKDHMKLQHDKTTFSCEICGKNFKIERVLRRHMKMHSTERPYSCDLCPQTFKMRFQCERHRKAVHKEQISRENAKNILEKSTETPIIPKEIPKETEKEVLPELPASTESDILQIISNQIPSEVIPITTETAPSQCYQTDFSLPPEMIHPYQEAYPYPQDPYTIPHDTYIPTQPDYSLNPQEIIEIPPVPNSQLLTDPSFLPQYPYDVWNNQFDCQTPISTQTLPQNPNPTYNIGSILSNLELMENNATFDPSYDFFDPPPQQQFYGNQTCPDTEILQWQQKIDQYDFNSQNHTLTDISNTFLRDEQRQNCNISSYVSNAQGQGNGEEQQIFNPSNVNVMLPSLADYLQNHFNPFNTMSEDVEH